MGELYVRQKNQSFARFKIDSGDLARMTSAQFSIFDFITNSFAFSPKKKQLSIKLLGRLSHKPASFPELVAELDSRKSTVYFLCLSLERSGLIAKNGAKQYALSTGFSNALRNYAEWWEKWVKTAVSAAGARGSRPPGVP